MSEIDTAALRGQYDPEVDDMFAGASLVIHELCDEIDEMRALLREVVDGMSDADWQLGTDLAGRIRAAAAGHGKPLLCPCGHGTPRFAPDGGWGVPEGARVVEQEYVPGPDGEPVTMYPMIHGRAYTYEP